jgi:hypothetical protein
MYTIPFVVEATAADFLHLAAHAGCTILPPPEVRRPVKGIGTREHQGGKVAYVTPRTENFSPPPQEQEFPGGLRALHARNWVANDRGGSGQIHRFGRVADLARTPRAGVYSI